MKFKADKYKGLQLSPEFQRLASQDPQKIVDCCNGVGSEVGFWGRLTYHFIPNTIWFLDITPCSDIHDVDYYYPSHFKDKAAAFRHKEESDRRLLDNLNAYIIIHSRKQWLAALRMRRAPFYWGVLCEVAVDSYLEGKTFDEN
ncbi:MAG: hypothetical protein NT118_17525 [Lentisphaerae bacterium]|nr:hypothetical protein [Lentisphaerota bacterium]